ncbi:iron-containing alcohol dehydrogenase family protein [Halococcus sp. AFM35]|uniref:iron-containing alcohol dehydrogenase family protein n=1 Tax=Halococcus sp. AFM35 TaxID=3421653 RepID=UPI003EBECCAC
MDSIEPFEYDNAAGRIAFGRGTTADLDAMVADAGAERALVVCGSNVGANRTLMDPIEAGLGDRLAGIFDETTPAKSARSAVDGVEAMDGTNADALVAVGGGSSIDLARAMRAIRADGRSYEELRAHAADTDALPVPDEDLAPLIAVPTTFAGADLSTGGSVTFDEEDEDLLAGFGDAALVPDALAYDPTLFETTPAGALFGSAMNGFDKGLELPYSRHANPLTDAPALRGLTLLGESLPRLPADEPAVMERAVAGIVLVQYGRATGGPGLLSVIHAFGHGLRAQGIQQGIAHAVMAPLVLELLFSEVDGRRDALAAALDVDGASDTAAAVVDAVREVRDGMELPARLREVEDIEREALPAVAEAVHGDRFIDNGPEGFDPTVEEIEETLETAW